MNTTTSPATISEKKVCPECGTKVTDKNVCTCCDKMVYPISISQYLENDLENDQVKEADAAYQLTGTVPYLNFKFLYPSRAENTVPISALASIKQMQYYLGQAKLNGSNTVIILDGKGNQQIYNRHRELKKLSVDFTALHRGNGFMMLNGEYMDKSKKNHEGRNFNGNYVIWDILCANNTILTGTTTMQRTELLRQWYEVDHYDGIINRVKELPYTFICKNFISETAEGLTKLYNDICQVDMYEGFVMKKMDAQLQAPYTPTANAKWQLKCRKSTKNYNF
ncbi:MAG TPA: hypothetical protein PLJ00_15750 [Chitinophagales bacterium]|nr:hypothetical protein [Chitinophagales bacterium]